MRHSDFDLFTSRPDVFENNSIFFKRFSAEILSRMKYVASSAYAVNFSSFFSILIPFIFSSDLIVTSKISRPKMKTRGDMGSPWRVDLSMLKGSEIFPLFDM